MSNVTSLASMKSPAIRISQDKARKIQSVLIAKYALHPSVEHELREAILQGGGTEMRVQSFMQDDAGQLTSVLRLSWNGQNFQMDEPEFAGRIDYLRTFTELEYQVSLGRPASMAVFCNQGSSGLHDVIEKCRVGTYNANVRLIVGDDEATQYIARTYRIPYIRYSELEVMNNGEGYLLGELYNIGCELIILPGFSGEIGERVRRAFRHKIISIRPGIGSYQEQYVSHDQARIDGAKLVGASAYFLSEHGQVCPIIAQHVQAITHADDLHSVASKGMYCEAQALFAALEVYCASRAMVVGNRTVIFEA